MPASPKAATSGGRPRSPVPPSRHNKAKPFLENQDSLPIDLDKDDTDHNGGAGVDGDGDATTTSSTTKEVTPPTKKQVSQTLCLLVEGQADRIQAMETLDTLATWAIKSAYQVRTMGFLKVYAAVPLLLDFLEDHMTIVEEYDSSAIKKAAHVVAELTYAGGKDAPPERHDAAQDMALQIVQYGGVPIMLQAIDNGIQFNPKILPSSISSLWSALWNINSKDAVHKGMDNETKLALYTSAVSCFEALVSNDNEATMVDQRIATNIFKILRHLMPPCSDFDEQALAAIQEQFAMNRIVDATLSQGEVWIANASLMKSLIQWMYRYLSLPGMDSEEKVPKAVWVDRVVPLVAKTMKEHPSQKEIHWCGIRILVMAVNAAHVDAPTMDATEAFSAIAVTMENDVSDPATKTKANELLTKLMAEKKE